MTNIIGHGHVIPRDDGYKAECGGPQLCDICRREGASQNRPLGWVQEVGATVTHVFQPPKLYTQADLDAALAKEREACAQICDETWVCPGDLQAESCHEAAAAIRARTTP